MVGLAFWQLLALVFLSALLDIPGITARRSLFPELVERAGMQMERANGFYNITRRIAGLLGPPLAGILIAVFGASNVLWIDAATFAVSAAIFAALVPALGTPQAEASDYGVRRYLGEIREGFQFLRRDAVLFWLTLCMAIGSLLAEPLYGVVLPVYAREVFGSAVDLGLVFAALAAGSIAGNVLYMLFGARVPRRLILIVGVSIRALSFWLLVTLPSLWIVAGAVFVNALFLEPVNPLMMTIDQERVPPGMRGRVFGAQMALGAGVLPLGLLLYGFLLDGLGLRDTLLLLAAVNITMPLAIVFVPALRNLQRPTHATTGHPAGTPLEEAA
jgi:MFS family permease